MSTASAPPLASAIPVAAAARSPGTVRLAGLVLLQLVCALFLLAMLGIACVTALGPGFDAVPKPEAALDAAMPLLRW
jgi:hypothetical protein